MKKSLFLALVFTAACGYVMAEEETATTASSETTVPAETTIPAEVPAKEEAAPMPEQAQDDADDTLDMDEMLGDEPTE